MKLGWKDKIFLMTENFVGNKKGTNDVCKYNYCVMIKSVMRLFRWISVEDFRKKAEVGMLNAGGMG